MSGSDSFIFGYEGFFRKKDKLYENHSTQWLPAKASRPTVKAEVVSTEWNAQAQSCYPLAIELQWPYEP